MKIYLTLIILIVISACSSGRNINLIGNTYVHQNGSEKQLVGFDETTIFFMWDDSLGKSSFKTDYTAENVNDTTINLILKEKNPYMENNIWTIIVTSPSTFYTLASGKKYILNK
ncbi:MAG TPA: hypothetical protein PLG90_06360 [Ignavibacteria bacterium]|nr:hypothetical protein [Ignavibacteria bacterium]